MADEPFDAYFERLARERQHVANALRAAIERAGPALLPRLSYGHPAWFGRGWVVSIVAHRGHCNLQLARGAELAALFPDRIEGTGKALRHVKVRDAGEIDGGLGAIIDAAIALDAAGPG